MLTSFRDPKLWAARITGRPEFPYFAQGSIKDYKNFRAEIDLTARRLKQEGKTCSKNLDKRLPFPNPRESVGLERINFRCSRKNVLVSRAKRVISGISRETFCYTET